MFQAVCSYIVHSLYFAQRKSLWILFSWKANSEFVQSNLYTIESIQPTRFVLWGHHQGFEFPQASDWIRKILRDQYLCARVGGVDQLHLAPSVPEVTSAAPI